LKVALACVCYLLSNGATYGGEILRVDACHVCAGHGLGLTSIGVIVGKKINILQNCANTFAAMGGRTPATSIKAATPSWLARDPDRGPKGPRIIVNKLPQQLVLHNFTLHVYCAALRL